MKKIFSTLLACVSIFGMTLPVSADKVGDSYTLPGKYTLRVGEATGTSFEVDYTELQIEIRAENNGQYTLVDSEGLMFPTNVTFSFDTSSNVLTFTKNSNTGWGSNGEIIQFTPAGFDPMDSFTTYDSNTATFDPTTGKITFPYKSWYYFAFMWNNFDTGTRYSCFALDTAQQNEEVVEQGEFELPGLYEFTLADPMDMDTKTIIKARISASNGGYVINEIGGNHLLSAIPFTFDAASNKLTFSESLVEGSIYFEPVVNDGFDQFEDPYDKSVFSTVTGEIDFQSGLQYGTFCFGWRDKTAVFKNYNPFYAVLKAVQIEDTGDEGDEDKWKDIGNATFMDGWILPLLGIDQYENQYEVLMQQNLENENRYRLVNPYKTGPAAEFNNHPTKEGYIEFDVTDPEKVTFSYVYAGFSNQHPDLGAFDDIYCIDMWSWMNKKYESNASQLNSFWKIYGYANSLYDAEKGEITLGDNGKSGYDLSYAACVGLPSQIRQEGDVAGGTNWQDPDDGHFLDMTAKIIFPGAKSEDPAAGDIEGNMTYQIDMNQGMMDEPELTPEQTIEVTASYNKESKQLTIYNFGEVENPITFTIDTETGSAVAANQIAEDMDGIPLYYSDIAKKEPMVYATAYTTDDNKTLLTVNNWGEGAEFGGDFGYFFFFAFYNTNVILDFTIEGLPVKPTEPEEPTSGDIEGNMSAQLDMSMGYGEELDLLPADEFAVTASYDEDSKILTIFNFADLRPIKFNVDLTTGKAVAEGEQISSVEEDPEYSFTYFYSNRETEEIGGVTAQVYNFGEDKTQIVVDPWGEAMDYYGMSFFITAYYNTVIVLDGRIPGLQAEVPTISVANSGYAFDCVHYSIGDSELAKATFHISVTTENIPDGTEVKLYFHGPNHDEDVYDEADREEAMSLAIGKHDFIFTIDNLARVANQELTIYAAAGPHKSEPAKILFDTTFDNSVVTGIESVTTEDGKARYFNLQGVEVVNPTSGEILIKVEGNKASKVVIK